MKRETKSGIPNAGYFISNPVLLLPWTCVESTTAKKCLGVMNKFLKRQVYLYVITAPPPDTGRYSIFAVFRTREMSCYTALLAPHMMDVLCFRICFSRTLPNLLLTVFFEDMSLRKSVAVAKDMSYLPPKNLWEVFDIS